MPERLLLCGHPFTYRQVQRYLSYSVLDQLHNGLTYQAKGPRMISKSRFPKCPIMPPRQLIMPPRRSESIKKKKAKDRKVHKSDPGETFELSE